VRQLLAAAVALAALAWAGPAAADASAPQWSAGTAPFLLSFSSGATPLFQEALNDAHGPGPANRLSYETADGSRHAVTDVLSQEPVAGGERFVLATDEPGRTAQVVVRTRPDAVHVDWTLEPADGVTTVWEAFTTQPEEHFLGGGESEGFVDLATQIDPLKTWHPCRAYAPTPFYASSRGYGVAVFASSVGTAELAGPHSGAPCSYGNEPTCPTTNAQSEVQLCFRTSSLAYDVYAGDPAQALDAYTAATGRAMLPPESEFGLVKWRDLVSGPGDVLDDVTMLQRLAIPIEWVLVDNPWERSLCYGSLEFDPTKFPGGPAPMIREIHARGVKLMMWVSPYVRRLAGCPYPPYPLEGLIGAGDSQALDLTQPAVYAEFVSRLKALAALGVDGVKGDRGDEVDLEATNLAGGPGTDLQNLYPYLFDKAIAEAFGAGAAQTWGGFVRAAAPQSRSLVPGIWAGDQTGTWDGLREAIRAAASAGASGFPVWGSDVGGYGSSKLTPDVFVRWAQLGAISPILEVGGAGPNATFWTFGTQTVDRFRAAAVLHYELFPYLYELAREATVDGSPVLRPLAFQYPGDGAAWKADLELLVGPSLLALPVTTPQGQTSPQYYPAGRWVPLWGGPDVVGPRNLAASVPLGTLPLYLRAGTAIPFDFRDPLVWRAPWRVNDLDRAGRIGWVYAPGTGGTSARSADTRFAASASRRRVAITITGSRRELQLLVLTPRVPRRVLVDGRAAGGVAGAAGLRARARGWALERGRFRGVVVKATATGRRTRIELDY
jgi:alpha-D-xyloside xylohydrolase